MHLRSASCGWRKAREGCSTVPNSRALGAGAAGTRNMPETCAAAFGPKGLYMRDGIPENKVSELALWTGLRAPAPPFAQRTVRICFQKAGSKMGISMKSCRSAVAPKPVIEPSLA
jgi:hypothetical protein